ncbi:MAG: MmcQ/YjbR family DNA-binding protein [Candidatus Thermoplasmatota archaeon]|nr:MmcQ/YjbR family DNA-binding protein [Candidatus Thermoplasmatota archaeon]
MDLGHVLEHCRKKKGETEDLPFDLETLTVRVGGRIFLLTDINSEPLRINLKCDPLIALDLREEFEAVSPVYHMNKVHWNTVIRDGSIPNERVLWMIDHSYGLVLGKLKKADRERILNDGRLSPPI